MLGIVDLYDPRTFKVHLAVIQPTPFCNIDCAYCYLPDRNAARRMTPETLDQTFRFLFAQPHRLARELTIAWHAGEPMTVPIEFYQSAFHSLAGYVPDSVQVENSIQTNATLITQEWCDLIKTWRVRVGVSLDGPKFLHDARRMDRAGRGTFDRVMRGVELLQANRIEFTTITVLSAQSLDFPDEIWDFFRQLGIKDLAFNCEDVEGEHLTSSLTHAHSPSRVQKFFRRLLELRNEQAPAVYIREIDYFLDGLPQWRRNFRRIENVPLCILGIASNGNVSTFSPELIGARNTRYGDFVFGNVSQGALDDVLIHAAFLSAMQDVSAGVNQCKAECEYFRVCGGGSPSTKLAANGTFNSSETLSCKLHIQSIGTVALDFMEKQHGLSQVIGLSVDDRVDRLLMSMRREGAKAAAGD
jgi:uncharacterized protein